MDYVPQLATLVTAPGAGDEWLHEIKYDGYRMGCRIDGGAAALISRHGKDWTSRFGEIARAASTLSVSAALLDGEVTVMLPDGRTSFQALQHVLSGERPRTNLVYVAFDLLWLNGEALVGLPLDVRKQRLRALLESNTASRIRFAEHVIGDGGAFFAAAQRMGLEGIVSKRRAGAHRPGRSRDWTKAKCIRREDFVIGGFRDQVGNPGVLGALLLGQFHDGRLIYAGDVGTGFTEDDADQLRLALVAHKRPDSAFAPAPPEPAKRRTHWVSPRLVCQVSFVEWTAEGRVRHPSYRGLQPGIDPRRVLVSR